MDIKALLEALKNYNQQKEEAREARPKIELLQQQIRALEKEVQVLSEKMHEPDRSVLEEFASRREEIFKSDAYRGDRGQIWKKMSIPDTVYLSSRWIHARHIIGDIFLIKDTSDPKRGFLVHEFETGSYNLAFGPRRGFYCTCCGIDGTKKRIDFDTVAKVAKEMEIEVVYVRKAGFEKEGILFEEVASLHQEVIFLEDEE